jgi:hypothetical protein
MSFKVFVINKLCDFRSGSLTVAILRVRKQLNGHVIDENGHRYSAPEVPQVNVATNFARRGGAMVWRVSRKSCPDI